MRPNRSIVACVLFFIAGSIASIMAAQEAEPLVIESPDFESRSSNTIEINKLELRTTETVLHGDLYGKPNYWVRLSSGSYLKGASGKVYKLRRSEGFPLDSTVYLPASGHHPFILYTEPLDKDETSFDFTEGDVEGAFVIKGIKTTKSTPDAPICCHLQGTIIDRPYSSRLMLLKADGDFRVATEMFIPIKEGRFEADIYGSDVEAYELVFYDEGMNGAWRPVYFFLEPGNIQFELYPMDQFERNQVVGGEQTSAYYRHMQQREALFSADSLFAQMEKLSKEDRYESPIAKALRLAIQQTNDPVVLDSLYRCRSTLSKEASLSKEAQVLNAQLDTLSQHCIEWELGYIKNNPSLMGYYLLTDRLGSTRDNDTKHLATYTELAAQYARLFPKHTYTHKLSEQLGSQSLIRIGGTYLDFTAPDFNGKPYRLSDQIKGKVALIDLWASWCGPCRRTSLSMIPVYEAFKDKGFVIVGIAREESVDDAINTVKKDKYPWLNLIDLKDSVGVWQKYGVGNAGGATFLVDRQGVILAIGPTAEQVEALLKQHLE